MPNFDKFPFHQQMSHWPNVRGYNDDSISYCFYLDNETGKEAK